MFEHIVYVIELQRFVDTQTMRMYSAGQLDAKYEHLMPGALTAGPADPSEDVA
jgi:hypothetical protein